VRKCSKCNVEASMYRATVYVCPKCNTIVNAEELFKLLESIGIEKEIIDKVQCNIVAIIL